MTRAPSMNLTVKLQIIAEWDSGKDANLFRLAKRLGFQRCQVSRVLCTRMNYVGHRGRPIVTGRIR